MEFLGARNFNFGISLATFCSLDEDGAPILATIFFEVISDGRTQYFRNWFVALGVIKTLQNEHVANVKAQMENESSTPAP